MNSLDAKFVGYGLDADAKFEIRSVMDWMRMRRKPVHTDPCSPLDVDNLLDIDVYISMPQDFPLTDL